MTKTQKVRLIARYLLKLGVPDCEVSKHAIILEKKLNKKKAKK